MTSSTDPEPSQPRRISIPIAAAAAVLAIVLAGLLGAAAGPSLVGGASPAASEAAKPLGPLTASAPRTGCPVPGTDSGAAGPVGTPAPPSGDTAPAKVEHSTSSIPAGPPLRALQQVVVGSPADPAPCGRYAFIRLRQWAADTVIGVDGLGTTETVLFELARWRAGDGSGRVTTTRIPARSTPESHSDDFPAGGLRPGVSGPLSSDPQHLARQMSANQPPIGGQAVVRAVADIYGWYLPDRDQRAAIVAVLAGMNLQWRGRTIDRAGRPGLAVSVDSDDGTSRDVLVFDPVTGRLLAYELVLLRNPGGLRGVFPAVQTYDLYLEQRYTATFS